MKSIFNLVKAKGFMSPAKIRQELSRQIAQKKTTLCGPHIKHIFIFNARIDDRIRVDGQVVKKKNVDVPQTSVEQGLLRIVFAQDWLCSKRTGVEERLDILPINVDELRGDEFPSEYHLLGRRQPITIEIS